VMMDPSAERLFAAIREGRPIGTVGTQLVDTPPSEANITVAVVDRRSGGVATEVESILADAGYDVTPGVLPSSEGPDVHGPAIVFAEGAEAEAGVVAAYFPDVPVVGPRPLAGAEVAVVVTATYRPSTPSAAGSSECPAVAA
jgi:hypothetical protein